MASDELRWLDDAKVAGELALRFVEGLDRGRYLADPLTRSAVERQLYILGEAFFQLSRRDSPYMAAIEGSRGIVGFRHVLAHGYRQIDHEMIWEVLQRDLRQTLNEIDAILRSEKEP